MTRRKSQSTEPVSGSMQTSQGPRKARVAFQPVSGVCYRELHRGIPVWRLGRCASGTQIGNTRYGLDWLKDGYTLISLYHDLLNTGFSTNMCFSSVYLKSLRKCFWDILYCLKDCKVKSIFLNKKHPLSVLRSWLSRLEKLTAKRRRQLTTISRTTSVNPHDLS
jgi:hypothetical protein